MSNVNITLERVTPRDYIGVCRELKQDAIGAACIEIYPRLLRFLTERNLAPESPPALVYHGVDRANGVFSIQPALFVPRALDAEGDIVPGKTAGGDALHSTHVGPYEKLGDTWHAVFAEAQRRGRPVTKPAWEIYVDDPGEVPAEALRTEIYVPIDD